MWERKIKGDRAKERQIQRGTERKRNREKKRQREVEKDRKRKRKIEWKNEKERVDKKIREKMSKSERREVWVEPLVAGHIKYQPEDYHPSLAHPLWLRVPPHPHSCHASFYREYMH